MDHLPRFLAKQLGWSEKQIEVYELLLRNGPQTAKDLYKGLSISHQTAVNRALNELQRHGAVTKTEGSSQDGADRWEAQDPAAFLGAAFSKFESAYRSALEEAREIQENRIMTRKRLRSRSTHGQAGFCTAVLEAINAAQRRVVIADRDLKWAKMTEREALSSKAAAMTEFRIAVEVEASLHVDQLKLEGIRITALSPGLSYVVADDVVVMHDTGDDTTLIRDDATFADLLVSDFDKRTSSAGGEKDRKDATTAHAR